MTIDSRLGPWTKPVSPTMEKEILFGGIEFGSYIFDVKVNVEYHYDCGLLEIDGVRLLEVEFSDEESTTHFYASHLPEVYRRFCVDLISDKVPGMISEA